MTLRETEPSVMDAGGHTVAGDHARNAPDQSASRIAVDDHKEAAGAGIAPIAHLMPKELAGDPTQSEPALYDEQPLRAPRARGAARKTSATRTPNGGSTLSEPAIQELITSDVRAARGGGQSISDTRSTSAAATLSDRANAELGTSKRVPGQDGGHPGSEHLSTPAAVHLSEPACVAVKAAKKPRARGSAPTARGTPPLSGAPNPSDPANVPVLAIERPLDRGGGLGSSDSQSGYAPAKKTRPAKQAPMPVVAVLDGGGGLSRNDAHTGTAVAKKSRKPKSPLRPKVVAATEGDGHAPLEPHSSTAVATIVDLWRQRQQLKKAVGGLNLQAMSVCRRYLGGDKEAAQKAWSAIQKGKGDPDLASIVQPYRLMMGPGEEAAHLLEKQLCKLVRTQPIWAWANDVRGLGELSVAGLIGEASGNPGDYKSVSALWKRMGLAVIGGERQRRVAGAEQALLHGYAPQRRAFAYVISCNLMKSQGSEGKYRAVYDRRKAYELERQVEVKGVMEPVTKAHAHNRALRVMVKELLKDAWAADRKLRRIADVEAMAA